MRRLMPIVLAACLAASNAVAQGPGVPLLDRIPASILDTGGLVIVGFGDAEASRMALAEGAVTLEPMSEVYPWFRVMPADLARFLPQVYEDMGAMHGFALTDLRQVALASAPPVRIAVLRIADPSPDRIGSGLEGAGYAPDIVAGQEVFVRGEDLATDLPNRLRDLFGYGRGLSSRVALAGDLVLQATTTAALQEVLADGPGLSDDARIAPLLSALTDPGLPAGRPIAGTLYVGLEGPVPVALVADIADGATDRGVLLIPASDPARADAIAEAARQAWDTRVLPGRGATFAEIVGAPLDVGVTPQGTVTVVRLAIEGPAAQGVAWTQSQAAAVWHEAIARGDLAVLVGG